MITLQEFDDERHGPVVHRIYEASFPESVRAPWQTIAQHRQDEELLVLVGDSPVAFALLRHLGDTTYTFVRYFAVDDTVRSQGIGARLLSELRQHLEEHGRTALLLDVEAPQSPTSRAGTHHDDDLRRIAFYERHGLALLPVPDYAPPEHGTTGEIVPLLLMGMPLADGSPLAGGHLDDCVHAVYRYRYGVAGPTQ